MDNMDNSSAVVSVRWFTVERAMLAAIIFLQVAILLWLWTDRRLRVADAAIATAHPVPGVSSADIRRRQGSGVMRNQIRSSFQHLHEADRMFDQMDAMFESAINDLGRMDRMASIDDGWEALTVSPAMDMKEQENKYIVVFSLPGARAHDVAVTIAGRILTVITVIRRENGAGEQPAGTFQRAVQLPGPVGDLQLAQATLTNGILRVSIPKSGGAESDGKPLKLL